ncbi:hypothetical protein WN73_16605 [Bradyrhizobium sp. CCBAU 45394]|nr:hypothetical protein [Bradyrhizobium sp. CCBAU 45394]
MMANHFFDDECQELLSKIRVKVARRCECTQSFYLLFLTSRICRRQLKAGLQFSYLPSTSEAFRENVDQGCIQIIDAAPKSFQFAWCLQHLKSSVFLSSWRAGGREFTTCLHCNWPGLRRNSAG